MLVNILSYPISDMNYKIRLFLITSLFALAKCQDTPGMVIKGDFDGYAKDGERIVVRNCGYFTGDECLDGIYYEDEVEVTPMEAPLNFVRSHLL